MKNINFHQTFKPEKQYISALLRLSKTEPSLTPKEISLETGIPMGESSGKVIPHIEYARFMGLLDYEKKDGQKIFSFHLFLSDFGNCVLKEDAGLRENLTLLAIHSMLVRKNGGAPIWSEMFDFIFPKYHGSVKVENAIEELNFIFGNRVTKKNFSPFVNSYSDMFSKLSFFNTDSEMLSLSFESFVEKDFVWLYGFILFTYWNELFSGRIEITAYEFSELKFGQKINMDSQKEYAVLELLGEKGIIRLNRQLNPYTILRTCTEQVLIQHLYSELL